MAAPDPQAACERLFSTFLAGLVLGGSVVPGAPFGGKLALAIGPRAPSDVTTLGEVDLARVRVARGLLPIDHLDPAPSAAEWALGAVLHDLVQATHPDFDAAFRRAGPTRLLQVIDATLDGIPDAVNAADALSRHTWFARMFEIGRHDTHVAWWTGSATFRGKPAPSRLTAWPELRRVQSTTTVRRLMDLPTAGAELDPREYTRLVARFLGKTPLTDLATLGREAPELAWTPENLAFVSMAAGRTMAVRAWERLPRRVVLGALGRATRTLFAARAVPALGLAIDALRDYTLALARGRVLVNGEEPRAAAAAGARDLHHDDAALAETAGALAATAWLDGPFGESLAEPDREALRRALGPTAHSAAAAQLRTLLDG